MKMTFMWKFSPIRSFTLGLSFFLLLAGASLPAGAQDNPWSLDDCIQYALDHNLDIKKQLLIVESNRADLLQSKLVMLPDLNGGASHIYNWGQTVDRYTNQFATNRVQSNDFYLSSNMTLFSGMRKVNTMKQYELNTIASNYDLDYMMDDISVAVASYYLEILYNMELLEMAGEQLEVTNQQVDRMRKMLEAGTLARGDLLNVEAQAASEELQIVEAENRLEIAYLDLMLLIDYPVSQDFRIEVPEMREITTPSITISSRDIYSIALENRPEIRGAEVRVESADKGISVARSYISPSLTLIGRWATGYSGASTQGVDPFFELSENPIGVTAQSEEQVLGYNYGFLDSEVIPWGDQLENNQNKTVGLSLSIPIYNGWQARNAISKAKLSKAQAEYNLEQTKLNLNKTIQQAYADAVAALKNHSAAEKKEQAQREAFKYARERFDVGLMNSVDYNEIKKNLTQAESELLQAKYRFIFTTTVLDFYMGKPLSLK